MGAWLVSVAPDSCLRQQDIRRSWRSIRTSRSLLIRRVDKITVQAMTRERHIRRQRDCRLVA